jgi:peptidoglycan/xylan/chitin deacetylase (PgdA/CDA1 family)
MHDRGRIIVLNYHRLSHYDTGVHGRFAVDLGTFCWQLNAIKERDIPVVSLDALIRGTFAGRFGIILTFDDGNSSDFQIAYPELTERNMTATFFPVVSNIGKGACVTWQQLSEMAKGDFAIGSHGLSHSSLLKLSAREREHELRGSKTIIEQAIGRRVVHFAAPYGLYSSAIIELARDVGYIALMTTTLRVNIVDRRPFIIHRWNMTPRTSPKAFRRILDSGGYISPVISYVSTCKQYLNAILGCSHWVVRQAAGGSV